MYYRINPKLPQWVARVLRETANGVKQDQPYSDDLIALESMPNRPRGQRCA